MWSRLIAVIITNRNFSNYPLKLVKLLLSVTSVVSGDSCAQYYHSVTAISVVELAHKNVVTMSVLPKLSAKPSMLISRYVMPFPGLRDQRVKNSNGCERDKGIAVKDCLQSGIPERYN